MTKRNSCVIKVALPQHLRTLAHVGREVHLEVEGLVTLSKVLDSLEAAFPVLRGTLRDPVSKQRRPFIRFFGCEEDLSLCPMETTLPTEIRQGREPLVVVGAMAGG